MNDIDSNVENNLEGNAGDNAVGSDNMVLRNAGMEELESLDDDDYDDYNHCYGDSELERMEQRDIAGFLLSNAATDETISDMIKTELTDLIQATKYISLPLSDEERSNLEKLFIGNMKKKISLHNANCSKDEKIGKFHVLPEIVIAVFLITFEKVVLLKRSAQAERGKCQLAVYQWEGQEKGLYVSEEDVIARLIRKYHYSIKAAEIKSVIKTLRTEAPLVEMGKYRNLIAVNNGIYDYDTKWLREFSTEYVFTSKSRVDFIENAPNVRIHNDEDGTDWDVESWMRELSENEAIVNLLWQGIGAVIRPNVRWDKTLFLYSCVGNNGKGTYCELLRSICGHGNYASISIEDTAKDFMLTSLLSASAVIVDENNTTGYLDDAKNFKTMVTGDVLQINQKYKDPVDFQFWGLIVQCINSMPRVSDKSSSFYRRLLMIPFEKCFTGKERKYIKQEYLRRKDVLEYVLYKVLYGMPSYNQFDIPAACEELLNDYKSYNDPVRQFVEEILPELVWELVPYGFLYDLYKGWYRENVPSGKVQGKKGFTGELKNILAVSAEWEVKHTSIPTKSYSFESEPLILTYNVTSWMNQVYQGSDPAVKCKPSMPSSVSGIKRVNFCVGTGEVEENPFADRRNDDGKERI